MEKREPITPDNLGPVVSVVAWVIIVSVLIAVTIKIALSTVVLGKRIVEDIVLLLATGFSIGFTVALSLAVPQGVGRHQHTLSSKQLDLLQKRIHAANILLVLVSTFAQSSVLIFLREVTPYTLHRALILAVAILVGAASIPSFFISIFACRPPTIWKILGDRCLDQSSFWQAFAGINLGIELALVTLPMVIVSPLTMERKRKSIVVSGFAARLAVMGAFAFYLYEVRFLKDHVDDWTFHCWKWLLASILVQGLSIITVCIPYIRNLLLSMESGMIQTGHFRLQGKRSQEVQLRLRTISDITRSNHSARVPVNGANDHPKPHNSEEVRGVAAPKRVKQAHPS